MATNLLVRDMDLRPPNIIDSRRLEVVADGLPLFGGVQLAVDTTLVSPLHCDRTADVSCMLPQFCQPLLRYTP